jgi:hypothetical protein
VRNSSDFDSQRGVLAWSQIVQMRRPTDMLSAGFSRPAAGSCGVSRRLCFVARVDEPTYISHLGNCHLLFVGSGVQESTDNVSKLILNV